MGSLAEKQRLVFALFLSSIFYSLFEFFLIFFLNFDYDFIVSIAAVWLILKNFAWFDGKHDLMESMIYYMSAWDKPVSNFFKK